MTELKTIGVVGAGVMGAGLGQALAQVGYRVVLVDVAAEALAQARENIAQGARFHHFLKKGAARQDAAQVLERVTFSLELEALAPADFVIENVTEQWAIKAAIYPRLDEICPDHTVFAANTSAIPITQIASASRRPGQVVGMHFMNPVPLKDTVEVIRGYHTTPETLATAQALLTGLGKEGIVVNDSPGFVSNRVLMLTVNEAIYLVHEQVAAAEDVDKIFKQCFGHPMGPLETADLIGLDTILLSLEVLLEQFDDPKFRPCPLLRKMVYAGLLGRKSGQGFYEYQA